MGKDLLDYLLNHLLNNGARIFIDRGSFLITKLGKGYHKKRAGIIKLGKVVTKWGRYYKTDQSLGIMPKLRPILQFHWLLMTSTNMSPNNFDSLLGTKLIHDPDCLCPMTPGSHPFVITSSDYDCLLKSEQFAMEHNFLALHFLHF